MIRTESPQKDVEESEPIVTTLFAKPSTGRPFLTLSQLKSGNYEETLYLSLKSYILFSDIGRAAWEAALQINKDSKIELARTSLLEEDKSWQVIIRNPDMTILVNSVRFRPIGRYTSAFYNTLEINSKPSTLLEFVRVMVDSLNRKPWEDESGELDWGNFSKKAQTSRKEVIEQWAMLSNMPELLPDSYKEPIKPLCQRCKKSTERGWIFCPFCGTKM
jgi:hypothetical protein